MAANSYRPFGIDLRCGLRFLGIARTFGANGPRIIRIIAFCFGFFVIGPVFSATDRCGYLLVEAYFWPVTITLVCVLLLLLGCEEFCEKRRIRAEQTLKLLAVEEQERKKEEECKFQIPRARTALRRKQPGITRIG